MQIQAEVFVFWFLGSWPSIVPFQPITPTNSGVKHLLAFKVCACVCVCVCFSVYVYSCERKGKDKRSEYGVALCIYLQEYV